MATIKVPKTPKKAFNRNRRPSALLLNQIAHLEWAVLPASRRKPHQLPRQRVTTEAQAAERVGQLPTMLFEAKAAAAAEPEPPCRVALGSLAPQNGFAFGLAFVEHYTPNESWRLSWNADAVATPSGSWRGGAYMKLVHTPATAGVVVRQPGAAAPSGAIG